MSKTKIFKVNDKDFTMREVTVQDAIDFYSEIEKEKDKGFLFVIQKYLPKITDIKVEKLLKLPPSELEEIYDTFKEVNSVFFAVAQSLGLIEIITKLIEKFKDDLMTELLKEFSGTLAVSLKPAT